MIAIPFALVARLLILMLGEGKERYARMTRTVRRALVAVTAGATVVAGGFALLIAIAD